MGIIYNAVQYLRFQYPLYILFQLYARQNHFSSAPEACDFYIRACALDLQPIVAAGMIFLHFEYVAGIKSHYIHKPPPAAKIQTAANCEL